MKILTYKGKLVEEIGHTINGDTVVFLHYIRQEDMPKCECGRPIDEEISIVENCKNWKDEIKGVETLTPQDE